MRTYVIGDVSGHLGAFRRALALSEADLGTLSVPDDVTIVSVGDLMDRGPDSLAVLELARALSEANPDRYLQLIGNHEVNWLDSYPLFVTHSSAPAIDALREWAAAGSLYVAAAVADPATLITHAGLTIGLWAQLGSPGDPVVAAERLNSAWNSPLHPLVVANGMLLGSPPTTWAGPLWADAAYELVNPWLDAPNVPFHQVHGHSSAYDWTLQTWQAPARLIKAARLDAERRHVHISVKNRHIIGVDPGLGRIDTAVFAPLRLSGAAVTPGPRLVDRARARLLSAFATATPDSDGLLRPPPTP